MNTQILRAVYDLRGIVQGVGFRPAVYRLAEAFFLTGNIVNRSGTVRITIEGADPEIAGFIEALPSRLPPNARIDSISLVQKSPIGPAARAQGFSISQSSGDDMVRVVIPPDLRICDDCAAEIMDPGERRYGYPFSTCTNCGPRYTVVTAMPYDRERTTMAGFALCPDCRKEYESPVDRRFHAETIACPACGPELYLEDGSGDPIQGDPLRETRKHLANGAIAAVRGIGGFLLAADAFNRETLQRLRSEKNRPHKPFAVMAPDIDTLKRYCLVSPGSERLLASPEAPIVIMDVNPAALESGGLPIDLIAPDTMTIGAMLPTSPLHTLLFEPIHDDPLPRFDLLIMTSGNKHGEPICIGNDEARHRLRGIADIFLLHNREIKLRNDDSVCVMLQDRPQVWRRARGYAPGAILLESPLKRCSLAMGAELKSTIAIGSEESVVMSPHIGDLETPEAIAGMTTVVEALPGFLERQPEVVAVDLHPDMHSSRCGRKLANELGVPVVEIQHHHAHAAACMAEHGIDGALALCFDGTGLGPDGSIWGAELLEVDPRGYRRLASFAPVPLPGGDAAVRHPARQLIARWLAAGLDITDTMIRQLGVSREQADTWSLQCSKRINSPMVHSAGRLFDAFSALLGLLQGHVSYEAQAAIRLEAAARRCSGAGIPEVPFDTREEGDMLLVDWAEAFRCLNGVDAQPNVEGWALAFHRAVASAAVSMLEYALSVSSKTDIVLSGGVFMNRVLSDLLVTAIAERGLRPVVHRQSPPNDGCISLGQAVIAGRRD